MGYRKEEGYRRSLQQSNRQTAITKGSHPQCTLEMYMVYICDVLKLVGYSLFLRQFLLMMPFKLELANYSCHF
jgi:hypothetical protein